MNSEQFIKFRQMIESEFSKAYTKHPKFCDDFTGASERFIVDELECWRKVNSVAPYHADAILNEEILEALEAYKQGDMDHCLQELAQCGAVILRMMDFVQAEIDNKEA